MEGKKTNKTQLTKLLKNKCVGESFELKQVTVCRRLLKKGKFTKVEIDSCQTTGCLSFDLFIFTLFF